MATRSGAMEIARSSGFLFPKVAGHGWAISVPHISDLQREASGRLSSFKQKMVLEEGLNSVNIKSLLPAHSNSIWARLGDFHKQLFRHHKGMLTCLYILHPNLKKELLCLYNLEQLLVV